MVCSNRRRGVFTANLCLFCRAHLFLFLRTNFQGRVGNLFYNSCHHLLNLLLLYNLYNTRVVGREHCLWTGIALRTIPSGLPILGVVFPGRSRLSYGTSPNLWVQNKFIKLRQSAQSTCFRPAEFFGEFFSEPPFNLFRFLRDVLLSYCRIECVFRLTVPYNFLVSLSKRPLIFYSIFSQSWHDSERKFLSAVNTDMDF